MIINSVINKVSFWIAFSRAACAAVINYVTLESELIEVPGSDSATFFGTFFGTFLAHFLALFLAHFLASFLAPFLGQKVIQKVVPKIVEKSKVSVYF